MREGGEIMEKPKRIKDQWIVGDYKTNLTEREIGYNQACDEWQKYHEWYVKEKCVKKEDLPTAEEIKEFLRELLHNWHMSEEKYHLKEIDIHQHTQDQLDFMVATAQVLAKRIGKEER